MVVESKEEGKDDVGDVTEPESRQELLSDADSGHELANTKEETPPLARSELTKQREGELSQNGTSIDRRTKRNEAAKLVTNLGANTRTEGEVHGTRTLRVTDVSELSTSSSSSNVVDNVTKIKGELLETPSPESRIRSSVFSVTSLEVGSNVGDPNIETLVDEPESHGTLFTDDEVRRVTENTVLKYDRVTNGTGTTGVRDSVCLENPTAFGDNVVFVALVAPELGIVSRSTGSTFAGDSALVFAVGL